MSRSYPCFAGELLRLFFIAAFTPGGYKTYNHDRNNNDIGTITLAKGVL
jgi:hypothetical protein